MYTLGTFFKDTLNSTNRAALSQKHMAYHLGSQDSLWHN